MKQQHHLEVHSNPARKRDKRMELIYLNEAMAKPLLRFFRICIYNSLQNACKGIASHSHKEMTAVFITGKFWGFTLEAKTYLYNFLVERKGTDFPIS